MSSKDKYTDDDLRSMTCMDRKSIAKVISKIEKIIEVTDWVSEEPMDEIEICLGTPQEVEGFSYVLKRDFPDLQIRFVNEEKKSPALNILQHIKEQIEHTESPEQGGESAGG